MPSARLPKQQYVNPEVLQADLCGVQNDVTEIKGTLSKLTEAVTGIERLEMRQLALIGDIEAGHNMQDGLEKRLARIEQLLPGLLEVRRWVVGSMVAGIGILLLALVGLVLYPRPYVVVERAPVEASVEAHPPVRLP
jgi:hypothetical protein